MSFNFDLNANNYSYSSYSSSSDSDENSARESVDTQDKDLLIRLSSDEPIKRYVIKSQRHPAPPLRSNQQLTNTQVDEEKKFQQASQEMTQNAGVFQKIFKVVNNKEAKGKEKVSSAEELKPEEYLTTKGIKALLGILTEDLERLENDIRHYSVESKLRFVEARIKQLNHLIDIIETNTSREAIEVKHSLFHLEGKFLTFKAQLQNFEVEQPDAEYETGRPSSIQNRFATNLTPVTEIIREKIISIEPSQKKSFNKLELSTLKFFTEFLKARSRGEEPDLDELTKGAIADLFVKARGNDKVNKQMLDFYNSKKLGQLGISLEVANMFAEFSYRTRGVESISEISVKADYLMKKINKKLPIHEEEKLTLKELGRLEAYSRITDTMLLLKDLEIDDIDHSLSRFMTVQKKAFLVHSQIEHNLQKHSQYKPGDIVLQNIDKSTSFRMIDLKWKDKLGNWALGIPLRHAAICYKDSTTDQLSHIVIDYVKEEFGLKYQATSTVYRLDPMSLLSDEPAFRTILDEMFESEGQDTESAMQMMYQDIQNRIHSQEGRYEGILNDERRKNLSGLAEVFTSLHTKKEKPGQFEALRQQMLVSSQFENQKMICSEFVAKALIVSLLEQQEVLYNKLINYLVQKQEDQLSTSEARSLVSQWQIFHLPISEKEKLSKVNPVRLLKILAEQKCIGRMAPSPVIQGLLKDSELQINPKEELLNPGKVIESNLDKVPEFSLEDYEFVDKETPAQTGPLSFEAKWSKVEDNNFDRKINVLQGLNLLFPEIRKRRTDIYQLKEEWRQKIAKMPLPEFRNQALSVIEHGGQLQPLKGGMGGAYLLLDAFGTPLYVIKPIDEDIMTLNNRKGLASPLTGNGIETYARVRKNIPLYTSVQTEALTSKLAEDLGFTHIVPTTDIIIFESDTFHDFTSNTSELDADREGFLNQVGEPDKEKLCSVQEFVSDSKELMEFLDDLSARGRIEGLSNEQLDDFLEEAFDFEDIEDCIIWCCITGETDGNEGNWRIFEKTDTNETNKKYGIKKVDNALCFPDNNGNELYNCLSIFPQIKRKLSSRAKKNILWISIPECIIPLKEYGKSTQAIIAFAERIELLKKLASRKEITLEEIDTSIKQMQDMRQNKLDEMKAKSMGVEEGDKTHLNLNHQNAASVNSVNQSEDSYNSSGTAVVNDSSVSSTVKNEGSTSSTVQNGNAEQSEVFKKIINNF